MVDGRWTDTNKLSAAGRPRPAGIPAQKIRDREAIRTMLAARTTAAVARSASTKTILPCLSALNAAPVSSGARLLSGSAEPKKKSLVTGEEGVHQTMKVSKAWRNKPLFRRQGDVRFKTGLEAANLLVAEAKRRDAHETNFIKNVESTMSCLSPVSRQYSNTN